MGEDTIFKVEGDLSDDNCMQSCAKLFYIKISNILLNFGVYFDYASIMTLFFRQNLV